MSVVRRRAEQRVEEVNPWVARAPSEPANQPDSREPRDAVAPLPAPLPGVTAPAPQRRLASRTLSLQELLVPGFIVSAHGGAGASTLAALSPGWQAAGQAWPVSPDPGRPVRVLLSARTSYTGLRAAQAALIDWTSGRVPVQLEGLALLACAPGRLPKQLRPLLELVRGGLPGRVWEIGWQPQWQLGEPTMPADRDLKDLFAALRNPPKEE